MPCHVMLSRLLSCAFLSLCCESCHAMEVTVVITLYIRAVLNATRNVVMHTPNILSSSILHSFFSHRTSYHTHTQTHTLTHIYIHTSIYYIHSHNIWYQHARTYTVHASYSYMKHLNSSSHPIPTTHNLFFLTRCLYCTGSIAFALHLFIYCYSSNNT